jgi:hypothetical protein
VSPSVRAPPDVPDSEPSGGQSWARS